MKKFRARSAQQKNPMPQEAEVCEDTGAPLDRFLQSVQAGFISKPQRTRFHHFLEALGHEDRKAAQVSKQDLIEALVTLRFNYVTFYIRPDFLSKVKNALNQLPWIIVRQLYANQIHITVDSVAQVAGTFDVDNRQIHLSEKFMIEDVVLLTAENQLFPYGLAGVITHELGHYFDWNLSPGERLSENPMFMQAWHTDLAAIPEEMKITYDELTAMCAHHGGFMKLPPEEKLKSDLYIFLTEEQELFAELFALLVLGKMKTDCLNFFPHSRAAAEALLEDAFNRMVIAQATPPDPQIIYDVATQAAASPVAEGGLIFLDEAVSAYDLPIGGKAKALGVLTQANLPIPRWFVILPDALWHNVTEAQWTALQTTTDGPEIQALIRSIAFSDGFQAELNQYLGMLCPQGEHVAVRSSAQDEDGAEHSFAGMLDSFLFVPPYEVAARITDIWCSAYSERVLSYRREKGIQTLPPPPAVIVQHMVNADVSGVGFGADPVTGDETVTVLSALYGLGTALVSGEADADTLVLNQQGEIVDQSIAHKEIAHQFIADTQDSGVKTIRLPDYVANQPALGASQARLIAKLVNLIGEMTGQPQDVEWAITEDRLYILQARPITTLPQRDSEEPGPPSHRTAPLPSARYSGTETTDKLYNRFDNSMVVEALSGMPKPLSYAIERKSFGAFYRGYLEQTTVAKPQAAEMTREYYDSLLCLIRGRAYLNQTSLENIWCWSPSIAYTWNRIRNQSRFINRHWGAFLLKGLGVPEGMLGHERPEFTLAEYGGQWKRLIQTIRGLVRRAERMPESLRRLQERVDHAVHLLPYNLSNAGLGELLEGYRAMMRIKLYHWQAPPLSDYLANVFYDLLGRLTREWCEDLDGTLRNDLLSEEATSISSSLHESLQGMAACALAYPAFVSVLCEGGLNEIYRLMPEAGDFSARYVSHMERFGDRCQEDSKLESVPLSEDPLPLFRSIGWTAQGMSGKAAGEAVVSAAQLAELQVQAWLAYSPLRRAMFRWVLGQAKLRIEQKENLRFESTRLMGGLRRVFRELGRRFGESGILREAEDIYFLEDTEITGFIEGTLANYDLQGLADLRKAEYAALAQAVPLAGTLESFGMVRLEWFSSGPDGAEAVQSAEDSGDSLYGKGTCAGVVRGQVHWVKMGAQNGSDPAMCRGKILVSETSDPGLVTLFPLVRGLLFQYGNPLSHSAIVARELGIPTVVSIRNLSQWLKEGDWVELDGKTGRVTKVSSQALATP